MVQRMRVAVAVVGGGGGGGGDGRQGQVEVLVSLQKVVALTHAGFSIASDASPWRESD